jgi:pimeloyl-ACP methyl ester carboxylesterase
MSPTTANNSVPTADSQAGRCACPKTVGVCGHADRARDLLAQRDVHAGFCPSTSLTGWHAPCNAVSAFPEELYQAPRSWTEKAYSKLIYYNRLDKGGHFAAWEQPELFSAELRAAFRSLREATQRSTGAR